MWKQKIFSLNYISECGKYIGIHKFEGCYWVFWIEEKKKIKRNALCVGALPLKTLDE